MNPRHDFDLPIVTPRTRIRRLAETDLGAFMGYRSDPVVGRYQGWLPMDAAASLAFLDAMSRMESLAGGEWMQVAIADAGTDLLLGDVGIRPHEDFTEAELGFTLGASQQGRGLATEAVGAVVRELFLQTPIRAIRGVTDARNVGSIALMERLEFARVSEHRAVFRDEPCIEYVYLRSR